MSREWFKPMNRKNLMFHSVCRNTLSARKIRALSSGSPTSGDRRHRQEPMCLMRKNDSSQCSVYYPRSPRYGRPTRAKDWPSLRSKNTWAWPLGVLRLPLVLRPSTALVCGCCESGSPWLHRLAQACVSSAPSCLTSD